jgi:hypothetical protein
MPVQVGAETTPTMSQFAPADTHVRRRTAPSPRERPSQVEENLGADDLHH